ncbi:DUF305 domain-containing protein [Actinokineospora inagensis]|uniref:DUF305 domain-containing protein n=1 Tax=Actinokineospora inagensis TaxID=103730 RepID=UPI00042664FD|nr:DUF305 domain-containing protein [Actinokineospora inagensis]
MIRKTLVGAALATLTLSACASTPSPDHNAADIAFAQGMIPHHADAITMSRLVDARTTNPDVLDLAHHIAAAQDIEITTMTGWLTAWNAPTHTMPMDDKGALESLTGPAFNRRWLTLMITHHENAITMSHTELTTGTNPDAKAMAHHIIEAQQTEITHMQSLTG